MELIYKESSSIERKGNTVGDEETMLSIAVFVPINGEIDCLLPVIIVLRTYTMIDFHTLSLEYHTTSYSHNNFAHIRYAIKLFDEAKAKLLDKAKIAGALEIAMKDTAK